MKLRHEHRHAQRLCRRVPQGTRGLKYLLTLTNEAVAASRPARDAWVEIMREGDSRGARQSRPARDAWVEIRAAFFRGSRSASRPARDAWVEIACRGQPQMHAMQCRVPQGTRGLKYSGNTLLLLRPGRVPQGTRGLKSSKPSNGVLAPRRVPQGTRGLK